MNNPNLPEHIIDHMIRDGKIRSEIVKNNFPVFFSFYFSHYIKYPSAEFQKNIMNHLNTSKDNLYIVAFRNSAKSTIITTAFPIWAILGKDQKKFILIICQTKEQAKLHMTSLKQELESNTLLKNDLGPFKEDSDEWNAGSLRFTNTGAKIMIASLEQSIRGLRHNQNRPDLMILDDIEDIQSTRTKANRNKTYQWFKGELIPAGDRNTRIIGIGNLLHEDSLMKRIEEEISEGIFEGTFMTIPLINKNGECAWTGKFPTKESLEIEQKKIGNDIFWKREFLLEIVSDYDQPIHREWISYYDELPQNISGIRVSVDPAISQKTSADYTAITTGLITGYGIESKLYILPNPINKRMDFPETVGKCIEIYQHLRKTYTYVFITFYIEDVAYQKALIQVLEREGLSVQSVPNNIDKRSRLALTGNSIQSGKIQFPRAGCEDMIDQMVNFGIERYDDMADSFATLALSIIQKPESFIGVA